MAREIVMDEQVVELIRDTIKQGFENTNEKIDRIATSLDTHITKDGEYWKKIDVQQGQIRLLKGIGGSSIVSAIAVYLWNKFH